VKISELRAVDIVITSPNMGDGQALRWSLRTAGSRCASQRPGLKLDGKPEVTPVRQQEGVDGASSIEMATFLVTGTSCGIGLELVRQLLARPESEVSKIFATTRSQPTAML
jgi:hypothetical protein